MQLGWGALQEAAGVSGLQLRKLDKRAEKALLQEQKASLAERLRNEDEPAAALSLAVPLIFAQASCSASYVGKLGYNGLGLAGSEVSAYSRATSNDTKISTLQCVLNSHTGEGSIKSI